MDGVAKELAEFFEKLESVGNMAIEAIKEQIDIEAEGVERDILDNTPENTGGLKASLRRVSTTKNSRYGYRLEFEGNAPDGTPYEKISNILNYGSSTIKAHKFVTKAVKRLKGLDDRAAKRFEDKLKT